MIASSISLSLFLGTAIGGVLGMTGAGGGVLAVPALMLGLNMPMTTAAPVALIAVGLGALLGSLSGLRQGQVRYRAAIFMAGCGSVCAPLGVRLAHAMPSVVLTVMFCAVMTLIAVRMLLKSIQKNTSDNDERTVVHRCTLDPATGRFKWNLHCGSALAGIGGIAGLFTGMLGVGGGFIIVPAFRQFSNLSMPASAATSLFVITLVSFSTVAGTLLRGIDIPVTGWMFVAATAIGMLAGRSLAMKLSASFLQRALAVTVLCVAIGWLCKTLF